MDDDDTHKACDMLGEDLVYKCSHANFLSKLQSVLKYVHDILGVCMLVMDYQ